MSYAESAAALEKGDIDAFFVVLGAPSTVVTELAESTDITVLPLDERTISAMTDIYDGYFNMTIPAGTYRGLETDIPTVGVKAVLTADSRVNAEQIQKITSMLFSESGSIKYTVQVQEPNLDFAVVGIPVQLPRGRCAVLRKRRVNGEHGPVRHWQRNFVHRAQRLRRSHLARSQY